MNKMNLSNPSSKGVESQDTTASQAFDGTHFSLENHISGYVDANLGFAIIHPDMVYNATPYFDTIMELTNTRAVAIFTVADTIAYCVEWLDQCQQIEDADLPIFSSGGAISGDAQYPDVKSFQAFTSIASLASVDGLVPVSGLSQLQQLAADGQVNRGIYILQCKSGCCRILQARSNLALLSGDLIVFPESVKQYRLIYGVN